jgi:chromosomal replication initiation ATPase DnaA
MEIKLGFATKHSPTVTIELNNKLIDTVLLDCACDVDDLEGALQMVTINADLPESNHTLRVVAKDIKDDEIIQVRHIELDNINMA